MKPIARPSWLTNLVPGADNGCAVDVLSLADPSGFYANPPSFLPIRLVDEYVTLDGEVITADNGRVKEDKEWSKWTPTITNSFSLPEEIPRGHRAGQHAAVPDLQQGLQVRRVRDERAGDQRVRAGVRDQLRDRHETRCLRPAHPLQHRGLLHGLRRHPDPHHRAGAIHSPTSCCSSTTPAPPPYRASRWS